MKRRLFAVALLLALPIAGQAAPTKPAPAPAPASWMGETTMATAMRSGPSDSAKATGAYEAGQLVVVVGETNGYDHVVLKLSGIDCWVSGKAVHRMTPAEVRAYTDQFLKDHPDAPSMFKNGGSN